MLPPDPARNGYGTGGPPAAENIHEPAHLEAGSAGWEVLLAADRAETIPEGPAHAGLSGLVDFVARKPLSA
ncbi:hypothetical protein ORIO_02015 [Cereibacter azotoformans]|uniref:Uncharacterized protein n=1 Tax=Cereibacter sphaeroides (strain ATCC 17025 / ATH 2.4.3) TaxID=349102 RepID=A4WPK2_CERS5|nr:hypothetical protein [Cereibacter azotoformans]MBO4169746.1 hypothetical protein [Cereibacter azotoformans]ULB08712.1 hypothetical protein ORIO_02015 [Cereibacter azotoformans]